MICLNWCLIVYRERKELGFLFIGESVVDFLVDPPLFILLAMYMVYFIDVYFRFYALRQSHRCAITLLFNMFCRVT